MRLGFLFSEETIIFPGPPPLLTTEATLLEIVKEIKENGSCETTRCETGGGAIWEESVGQQGYDSISGSCT